MLKQTFEKYTLKYRQMPNPMKAGLWFTISGFLQKTISFLTMPIITRLLTTEEYGVVTVFNSWESIFLLFVTLYVFYGAFNTAMMDFEKERDGYSSSLVGFITVSTIVWFAIYFVFRDFVNHLTGMTFTLSCIMFIQIFFQGVVSVWFSRLKFSYDYKPIVISTIVLFGLSPIFSIIGIYEFPHHHVEAKLIGHVCAYSIVGIYAVCSLLNKGHCFYLKRYWKYAVSISLPLVIHYVASLVLGQADRIMISRFISDSYAAIYAVAFSVSMILTILTTSANEAIAPRLYECIKYNSLHRVKNAINILLVLVVVALFYVMLFGPEIIMVLATPDYYEAKWAIPPVMGSLFFTFLYQIFANIEFYYKKTSYIITASIAAAIVNIVLNALFIPRYGFLAAAYTTLVCYILFGIFHYVCAKYVARKEGLAWPFQMRLLFALSILLFIALLGALILYHYTYLRYFVILVFSALLYLQRNKIIGFVKHIKVNNENEAGR